MDTFSASDAARALCMTVPRVQRAIDRLDMEGTRGLGGRVTLTRRRERSRLSQAWLALFSRTVRF